MIPTRKLIRQAIVDAIIAANIPSVGANVFRSRTKRLEASELPCVVVFALAENISLFNQSPRRYKRTLQVKIEIATQGDDSIDEQIDDIADAIEAVFAKPENQFLGQLAESVSLTGFDSELPTDGERRTGGGALSFDVTYYTEEAVSPDTLDNFDRGTTVFDIGSERKVTGNFSY